MWHIQTGLQLLFCLLDQFTNIRPSDHFHWPAWLLCVIVKICFDYNVLFLKFQAPKCISFRGLQILGTPCLLQPKLPPVKVHLFQTRETTCFRSCFLQLQLERRVLTWGYIWVSILDTTFSFQLFQMGRNEADVLRLFFKGDERESVGFIVKTKHLTTFFYSIQLTIVFFIACLQQIFYN